MACSVDAIVYDSQTTESEINLAPLLFPVQAGAVQPNHMLLLPQQALVAEKGFVESPIIIIVG